MFMFPNKPCEQRVERDYGIQSPAESNKVVASSRACQQCSKAKAKCVSEENASGCVRCSRLGKECIASLRKSRKRRSPNVSKSTTQLEQKIESLVTLLSTRGIPAVPTPPISEPSPPATVLDTSNVLELPVESFPNSWPRCPPRQPGEGPQEPMNPFIFHAVNPSTSAVPPSLPNGMEHLLDLYKDNFAPNFPFIVVPPSLSATELRSQKPWLLKAIYIVACQEDRVLQLQMSREILTEVATAMLLRAEKSLDLLQCLLIYNAWTHTYTPNTPSSQSSGMLHLTIAMVHDLGMTKQYREMDSPSEIIIEALSNAPPNSVRKETKRTVDEMRTLCACYVLTSMTSYYMKRVDGLPRSPYILHCCKVLEEAAEYESDIVLVTIIRLYGFVELINTAIMNRLSANGISAPIWMQIASIQRELQAYWETVSPERQANIHVRTSYHSTNLFIYRSSLHKHLFTSPTPESSSTHRIDTLYACLLSAKALLDHSDLTSKQSALYHSSMDNAHIGHGLSILLKLTLIEEPGWDLLEVRRTADLLGYLDRSIAMYADVGAKIDGMQKVQARHSFPSGCAKVMGRVRTWYEGIVPRAVVEGAVGVGGQEDMGWMGMGMEGGGVGDLGDDFDYLDEAYWFELIGN